MNYGQMIRTARKKLGLNQSDLANDNISRTLISEIEKGNTNLVSTKALLIYKKLINESYLQDIEIELDFDGVLKDNFEYLQLRQAREVLTLLINVREKKKKISAYELENYRLFALRSEIGIFKYYIFRELALHERENHEFKIKVLFNALDFLKWQNFEEIYVFYDQTLKEVTLPAYNNRLFEKLIHYYKYQKDRLMEIEVFIEPRIYYNLSLFNDFILDYEKAYRYLDKYLEYKTTLSSIDYYDALIGRARLATRFGRYAIGIKLYEELLNTMSKGDFRKQRSIVLGNILFNIPKLTNRYSSKKIEAYLKELTGMLPDALDQRNFPSDLLVNISIGYGLINEVEESNNYIRKAFEYANSPDLKANVIVDTLNNIETVDIDLVIKNIVSIDIDELRDQYSFMRVLLKLQKKLYNHGKSQYLQVLDEYIDKI